MAFMKLTLYHRDRDNKKKKKEGGRGGRKERREALGG